MGVTGLWQVVEPAGRPVKVEALRGKVLAIDVSIWLHQLVKGFRDKDGNPLPNAHLLGVFHRVCKLLHYGIKPVFVFDGGVPELKRQTMVLRRKRKIQAQDKSEVSRQKILSNYLRQQLQRQMKQALPPTMRMESQIQALSSPKKSKSVSPTKKVSGSPVAASSSTSSNAGAGNVLDTELQSFRDKFASRETGDDGDGEEIKFESDSDDSDEYQRSYGMDYSDNFSAIVSSDFDALPLETQHEVLFEMQESRKMNSWGKIDKMPQSLQDFSTYQMDRLVKRRFLQKKIQSVQQEMGQRHIHVQNLDDLLKMDYSFDGNSEVIGSQEKGCILVKTSPQKKNIQTHKEEPKPGSSTSGTKGKPEVITLDDYGEDGWISSGSSIANDYEGKADILELESISCKDNLCSKVNQLTDEDEQLALAIQMSLFGNTKPKNETCVEKHTVDTHGITDTTIRNCIDSEGDKPQNEPLWSLSNEIRKGFDANTSKPIEESVISTLQMSQISSCSKFLDTVGFSSKVNTSGNSILLNSKTFQKKNDTSESDSDFEAVEDLEVSEEVQNEIPSKCCEKKLVENFPQAVPGKISLPLPGISVSSTVATINLNYVIKEKLEEDMFADIFSKDEEKLDHENSNADTKESHPAQEQDDVNWDSDPELEDLSEMEEASTHPSDVNGKDTIAKKLTHEEFLSKFIKAPAQEPKPSSSVTSSNETITRTLGRMPFQGTENRGPKIITAEYMQAQEKLNSEQDKLQHARGFQERVATSISDQMSIETQELISLFGIPYIISPMEAESQCAYLDTAYLTDGTITDDSDIWLFNGRRVYKNFYASGGRQLEFYQQADIIRVLNLDREKLVLLAMLIGGDYCEGIEGVGPVTALELISEFPTNSTISFDSLLKFREWWDGTQNQKRDPIVESKVKDKLRKLKLTPGFPSKAVYEAYMNPTIDNSTEPFQWGNPDLDSIRTYAKDKFGWDQNKCDGMLLPVLKNLRCQAEQSKQLTMDRFVTFGGGLENPYKRKKGSKRLHTAVKKLKRLAPVSNELNLSSDSDSTDETEKQMLPSPSLTVPKKKLSKITKKQEVSSSSNIFSSVKIPKTNPAIPQKVQEETQRNVNKQKAIKILKNKSVKK